MYLLSRQYNSPVDCCSRCSECRQVGGLQQADHSDIDNTSRQFNSRSTAVNIAFGGTFCRTIGTKQYVICIALSCSDVDGMEFTIVTNISTVLSRDAYAFSKLRIVGLSSCILYVSFILICSFDAFAVTLKNVARQRGLCKTYSVLCCFWRRQGPFHATNYSNHVTGINSSTVWLLTVR